MTGPSRLWFDLSERVRGLFNPGEEALDVPPLEGPLKPNNALEAAQVLATVPDVDNVAVGAELRFTQGPHLLRLGAGGPEVVRTFDAPITALLALSDGGWCAAVEGSGLQFVGGPRDGVQAPEPSGCVTDLAEVGGALVATVGSAVRPAGEWLRDLLCKGSSGRVVRLDPATSRPEVLADGLAWPAGVSAMPGGSILVSVAWAHALVVLGKGTAWRNLPGYPGRIRPASDGGFWLSVFAMRTKLVEFVLQEDEYRNRMMSEIEPRYWVGPALATHDDHWEPLQGGGIKQLGTIKPWAPPRSYGLVARLDDRAQPIGSVHSRAGQHRHGITAIAERGGELVMCSRGGGLLLGLPAGAIGRGGAA